MTLATLTPERRERILAGAWQEARRRAAPLPLPTTHPGQDVVLSSPARFKVLRCGRRWRKSTTALLELLRAARRPRALLWWIWPTGPMGQTGWDMLRQVTAGRWDVSESRRRVTAPNGSEIWVKSSDHEDGLRGAGLDGAAFAECREMRGRVYHEIIRPALADRKGWALFESTPRGFDWFHDLELYAKTAPGWAAWHFTSYDNPELDPAELDLARTTMTERMFRQEILAEYLSDGAYFQNVDACATVLAPEQPAQHPGHPVVMGIDWGKSNDWTVLTAICRHCSRVVDWDRFNQIDYIFQRERVKALAKRWHVRQILPERNSIGQPNIEMLRAEGLPIDLGPDGDYGFNTTAATKALLIESLALALSQKAIRVPADYAPELRAFEIETRPAAVPKFAAPEGGHDDCVISLALAWRLAGQPEASGEVSYAQPYTIGGGSPY